MVKATVEDIKAVVMAAHELEHFLYNNVGATADYPVKLVCDNTDSVEELVNKLQKLHDALAPLRKQEPGEYFNEQT